MLTPPDDLYELKLPEDLLHVTCRGFWKKDLIDIVGADRMLRSCDPSKLLDTPGFNYSGKNWVAEPNKSFSYIPQGSTEAITVNGTFRHQLCNETSIAGKNANGQLVPSEEWICWACAKIPNNTSFRQVCVRVNTDVTSPKKNPNKTRHDLATPARNITTMTSMSKELKKSRSVIQAQEKKIQNMKKKYSKEQMDLDNATGKLSF